MIPNPTVARELEAKADRLAAIASTLFLEHHAGRDDGTFLHDEWAHHFRQRVLELSAALATGEERLFTERVNWTRRALQARPRHHLPIGESLRSLRTALTREFDADTVSSALLCIDSAINDHGNPLPELQLSQLQPGKSNERLALLYLHAALEGNVREAMNIVLAAIDDGLPHADAITRVLLPAQSEVGHLWHIDHVTVAEEHLVTTTTQRLMAVIAERAPRLADRGQTAVAASIAGNAHDTGIRAIAYLLELEGWRTIYLGSDVPRNDLPAAIHFFDADVVLLSTALSSQIPRLADSIEAIRSICEKNIRIMVGGSAFADAPDAWQRTGADGYTGSADEAVAMASHFGAGMIRH